MNRGGALMYKALASIMWMLLATSIVHAAPGAQPFRSSFGVVTKFTQGQPQQQLGMLADLKVAWVRDFVHWAQMEPKAGEYADWPKAYARRLAYYKQNDIGVIYVLAYANGKAYPNTKHNPHASIDPEALGRYATHVAKALRAQGLRFAIEVWNEPHNFQIMKMVGGHWNGAPPSPWVAHYIKMLNQVQRSVAEVDPNIPVLSSEDVWVNHYRFAESKALTKSFRHIGLHPYTDKSSSGPEVAAPKPLLSWAKPFTLVDEDRSFQSAVDRLRAFTQQSTGTRPEVWITEWGWRIGTGLPKGRVTAEDVAAFLPRAFIVAHAAGTQVLCWFSTFDAADGPYGLISNSGEHRPAYAAYKTMADQIGDAHYLGKISRNPSRVSGLQAYLFKTATHRVAVLWSASDEDLRVTLPQGWVIQKITTNNGAELPAPKRSLPTVQAGQAPVYIEFDASETTDCRASADLECK